MGESVFDLYGFASQNELNSFKLLLGVSGVGPKAALAILSANTPEALAMSIVTGDEKALTAAQGIGKKIASAASFWSEGQDGEGNGCPDWTFPAARVFPPLPCSPAKLRRPPPRWGCWAIPVRRFRLH